MDEANARAEEQASGPETPEDVAILYSWANLPGAKYRDFSASRREYRAQQRARAAEAQRQAELQAARELEHTAQREVEEAQRQLEQTSRADAPAAIGGDDKGRAEQALRLAEERAEQERQEVQRRQQSAEDLRQRAERARQEMLEARKRAEEQAARYAEMDAQYQERMQQEQHAVPGEITDPYYYTGHVDPAYFASTPGVRTAQAARVSTERKAYVYPMHPGSDEYDSGTIVTYRSGGNFAPSPAHQLSTRSAPLREEEVERAQPSERERLRPILFGEIDDSPAADMDDDYYDSGRTTRLFTPPAQEPYPVTRDTAAPDLHIRPATRVSNGEHESYASAPRRSPLPTLSVPATRAISGQRRPLSTDPFATPTMTARQDEIRTERRVEGMHARAENEMERLRLSQAGMQADPGRVAPIRCETPDDGYEDGRSSRMFIPSPRRRVLGVSQSEAKWPQAVEPTLAETRTRDAANTQAERSANAEVEARAAEDRFVQQQEPANADTLPESAGTALDRAEEPIPPAEESLTQQTSQWRAVNRLGDSSLRRRREPPVDSVARTVRQQRVEREPEPEVEAAAPAEAEATQPAWLSAERPSVTRSAQEFKADPSPILPSSFEDPKLPTPRMVPRPSLQSAETRARLQNSGERQSAERWRGAGDLRPKQAEASASDTLQQSRERVASRWFALSGLMGSEDRRGPDPRSTPRPAPMLCVLSISGGVGKTSIVATLGRALSSLGEKVLLADTNVHGILPYYFGAREQRPGTVRTFTPPPGSSDAPVVLVSYDSDRSSHDDAAQTRVVEDLQRRSQETQRVLLDVGVSSAWLARKVASANPWVLVPVAPDMNSVIGTQAVERVFQDVTDANGRPVKPCYVLNQYDSTLPLHLDVREVLRQFLGERLLPIMLHRTPAVSEALAEGMTVIDYAPGTAIAEDYMNLATWVRHLSEPGVSQTRPARWSER